MVGSGWLGADSYPSLFFLMFRTGADPLGPRSSRRPGLQGEAAAGPCDAAGKAALQEGFLEEVAMGLLSESELGRWKGRAFQAEGAASAKAWRPESRLRAKESASLPRTIADGSGEALNSLPKHLSPGPSTSASRLSCLRTTA